MWFIPLFIAGWWLLLNPLKNIRVSWDDDLPDMMESHNPAMFQSPATR